MTCRAPARNSRRWRADRGPVDRDRHPHRGPRGNAVTGAAISRIEGTACRQPTATTAQVNAVRLVLARDHDAANDVYISQQAEYEEFKTRFASPEFIHSVTLHDLPSCFRFILSFRIDSATLEARLDTSTWRQERGHRSAAASTPLTTRRVVLDPLVASSRRRMPLGRGHRGHRTRLHSGPGVVPASTCRHQPTWADTARHG
jgi:hypothetical protein